jgi:glutaredoxin 3
MTPEVTIYTSAVCPFCFWAKDLLQKKDVSYTEIRIDLEEGQADAMIQRSGRMTVPQIFIGEVHVGGYDDMAALDREGKLDPLLGLA